MDLSPILVSEHLCSQKIHGILDYFISENELAIFLFENSIKSAHTIHIYACIHTQEDSYIHPHLLHTLNIYRI